MKAFFLHDEHRFPVALVVTELKMHGVLFAVATHNPIDFFDKRIAVASRHGETDDQKCWYFHLCGEQRESKNLAAYCFR